MRKRIMFKVSITVFVALSFLLGSCEARMAPSLVEVDNSQGEQVELPENETLSHDALDASFTPLRFGKKVTQLSPYVMATYGRQKFAGERFQVSLFAAHTEEMIYENDETYNDDERVLAVMFVSRGDLHEMPLTFYILGDLHLGFNNIVNFCIIEGDVEDKLVVYASNSCDSGIPPKTGTITIELILDNNSVMIDGMKTYKLN